MTLETVLAELLRQDWLRLDDRADGPRQLAAYLAPHIEAAVRDMSVEDRLGQVTPPAWIDRDVERFTELLAERCEGVKDD